MGTRAAETALRKARILEAAAALAAEGGYEAVQIRDVAAQAEVALGTLYRHYASKDQLLVALIAQEASTLQHRLAARPPRGRDAASRVAEVLRRGTLALAREPRVAEAVVTALSSPDPEAAAAKQEVLGTLTAVIGTAIGDDPAFTDDGAAEVARVLGHVWFAALVFWVGGLSDTDQMTADLEAAARAVLH